MKELTRVEVLRLLNAKSLHGTAQELKTFVAALGAQLSQHGEQWVAEHRHAILFGWKTIAVGV